MLTDSLRGCPDPEDQAVLSAAFSAKMGRIRKHGQGEVGQRSEFSLGASKAWTRLNGVLKGEENSDAKNVVESVNLWLSSGRQHECVMSRDTITHFGVLGRAQ